MERVFGAELCCGRGGRLCLAVIPSRELVQWVRDERDREGVEEGACYFRVLLLRVQAGAACRMAILDRAGIFMLLLTRLASEEALAPGLFATDDFHRVAVEEGIRMKKSWVCWRVGNRMVSVLGLSCPRQQRLRACGGWPAALGRGDGGWGCWGCYWRAGMGEGRYGETSVEKLGVGGRTLATEAEAWVREPDHVPYSPPEHDPEWAPPPCPRGPAVGPERSERFELAGRLLRCDSFAHLFRDLASRSLSSLLATCPGYPSSSLAMVDANTP